MPQKRRRIDVSRIWDATYFSSDVLVILLSDNKAPEITLEMITRIIDQQWMSLKLCLTSSINKFVVMRSKQEKSIYNFFDTFNVSPVEINIFIWKSKIVVKSINM